MLVYIIQITLDRYKIPLDEKHGVVISQAAAPVHGDRDRSSLVKLVST
jgi:hypothetical protein